LSNQSYAYAMGRVRAEERKMLARAQLERVADARTPQDAMRVLREAGYGAEGGEGGPSEADYAGGYERMLADEHGKLVEFFKEVSPEPALLEVFLRREDYHNAKALLKAEFSGRAPGEGLEGVLSPNGLIEAAQLARWIRERAYAELPPMLSDAVRDAVAAYQATLDPQAIDVRLDKAAHANMLADAEALGNEYLTGLARIYIDLANIQAFLRVKAMKRGWEFMQGALIPDGTLDEALFARYFGDTPENFAAALPASTYGALCEEGARALAATGRFAALERGADDYVVGYARDAQVKRFEGPEILVGYLVAKLMEIKNVRIAMCCKQNGLPADATREMLRASYAG